MANILWKKDYTCFQNYASFCKLVFAQMSEMISKPSPKKQLYCK